VAVASRFARPASNNPHGALVVAGLAAPGMLVEVEGEAARV